MLGVAIGLRGRWLGTGLILLLSRRRLVEIILMIQRRYVKTSSRYQSPDTLQRHQSLTSGAARSVSRQSQADLVPCTIHPITGAS